MIPDVQFAEGEAPLYTGSIAPTDEAAAVDDGFIEEPLAAASVEAREGPDAGLVEEPLYTGSIDGIESNEVPGQIPNDAEFVAAEEPVLTGSTVAAAEEEEVPGQLPADGSPAADDHLMMAGSYDECRPGQFWMAQWETAEVPIACPR